MTDIITHEELITRAFQAYENSTIDYGMDDTAMINKMRNMNDSVLWGFIKYCEDNRR